MATSRKGVALKVRPGLFEFFTVQLAHPLVKRHLLRGAYLLLGALPPLAASLCVVSAMLADARRNDISRWVKETLIGSAAVDFGVEPHSYLARRMEQHRVLQKRYLAQYNMHQSDPTSFLEVVIGPYRNVFAAAGGAKKLLRAGLDVAEGSIGDFAPEDPNLLLGSKSRIAYDENIVVKVPILFAEIGLAFGYLLPDVTRQMAGRDIVVDPIRWSEATKHGLHLPLHPPFPTLSAFTRELETEVEYFYSLHSDPPGRPLEWTNRVFGKRVMAVFAFHTYQHLFQALMRIRDREQPGA